MDQLIELLKQPSSLYLALGFMLAISPVIWKLIKWFWSTTKEEVKKEVQESFNKENKQLEADLIKKHTDLETKMVDQIQLNKETLDVVKESVSAMREENKVSHESSKQMLTIMEMHLEELKFLQIKVTDHEDRIMKVEKITGK